MSFAIADAVGSILHSALDGLSLRQRVTADNIANIDTPGYRASTVDFETELRKAVAAGGITGASMIATTTATNTPSGANDNTVDLRKETLVGMQSLYQYQVMTRAVTDRFALLTTVAKGS